MSVISGVLAEWRRPVRLRDRAGERWVSFTASEQARIKAVALISLVAVAFHYSLSSLLTTLGYETPLAYVGLVPVFAIILAWVHRVPRRVELPIHDRQLDYIIGVPLMGGAFVGAFILPSRMGLMYWFDRVDLLLMPLFVAGAVILLFGLRAAWRQKLAIAYLFLAWPWPYEHVLLGTLNGFTNITLSGLTELLKVIHVASPVSGNPGLFQVTHHGHTFPVSVVTACSGIDGMVGFLLVGIGFMGTVVGGRLRKLSWLVVGLAVLWTTNLLRLLLIFWAGSKYGENFAINILHPVAGLIVFCLGVTLMILLLRPFKLSLFNDLRSPVAPRAAINRPGTQRVFAAVAIVAVAAFALCVNNTKLKAFNPVSNASGEPRLSSFLADPASPNAWTANWDTEYYINKPLFGQSSRWFRYVYVSNGKGSLFSSMPVTGDVINAAGLSGFDQYGVEACYTFHGYVLRDIAKVNLGNGISGQALSYSGSSAGSDWSLVYWIWPVATATGTRYERVILYLQNTAGTLVKVDGAVPGITGLKGALSNLDPQEARLINNRAFLVAFARVLVADQTHKSNQHVIVSDLRPGGARSKTTPTRLTPLWVRFHVVPIKATAQLGISSQ